MSKALLVALLGLLASVAQAAPPPEFESALSQVPKSTLVETPSAEILKSADPEMPWRADLLVGLPIGLRLQRQVTGPLWLEVGATVYLIVPAAFTAVRFDIEMATAKADSFHLRPGVGVGVSFSNNLDRLEDSRTTTWITADVDVVWQHRWGPRFVGEFGFKIGGLYPLIHDPFPMPRLALICGVQF